MTAQAQNLQPIPQKRSLLVAMAGKYCMDPTDFKNTIKATVMPSGATNEQMAAFLLVANEYDLNPLTREIHAFPAQGGGVTSVVGIDGWINLAQRRAEFDGMEFAFGKDESGDVETCTCSVYRKDRSRPIVVTEYMDECARTTAPWKSHPRRMLRHKSAIQAIRYAFGFSGIKDEDDAEIIYANATVIENDPSQASEAIMGAARQIAGHHEAEPAEKEVKKPKAEPEQEWPKQDERSIWRDSRGIGFMSKIHGMTSGGVPAVSKAGHFCKRRGCDLRVHAQMESDALAVVNGDKDGPAPAATKHLDDTAKDAPSSSQAAQAGKSSATSVVYPDVRSAISSAATLDTCDEAQDLLREFQGPADQADELTVLLIERRRQIESLMAD